MSTDIVQITDDLTFANPKVSNRLLDALPSSKEYTVDFSQVGKIDSTAVATMVRLQRRAEVNDAKLTFVNIPQRLMRLLIFYQLDTTLNLDDSAARR